MVCLISLHRILSLEEASGDDIDEVDQIQSEDRYRCSNLASSDDRESSDEESEHDSTRVTHDDSSRYISSRESIGDRDDDREDREEESAIFLSRDGSICEVELQCQSSEDDEADQSKSTSQSWDTIRKIHRVKYYHIPEYGDDERYPVDGQIRSPELYIREPLIEREDPAEDMSHIGYLDTRESDQCSYSDLHQKSHDRWYLELALADCIHIVYPRDESDHYSDREDDREAMFEEV